MKTVCIVMAHAGTEETCKRHMPYWQASARLVAFYCPANSVMVMRDALYLPTFGLASHHDRMANERFRHVITQAAALTDYDRVVIHEYDSICIGGLPATPVEAVAGNSFEVVPETGFLGTAFVHPPLIIHAPVLRRLADLLEVENMNGESGFWDRLLGHVCQKNGIPIWNFRDHGLGYSQNTIKPHHHAEAQQAVAEGARLIHGIKDQETLALLNGVSNARGGPRVLPRGLQHGAPVAEVGGVPRLEG